MSVPLPDMASLLYNFQSTYLDARGVGVRRFAELSRISRTRLKKFFNGTAFPTEREVLQMSLAMNQIEAHYEKTKELDEKKKFKTSMETMTNDILNKVKEGIN